MTVHSRKQVPRPDAYGVDFAAGQETAIGVKLTSISRLAAPYKSGCLRSFPARFAPFAPMDNEYSEDNCRGACVAAAVLAECNCYLSYDIQRFLVTPTGNISRTCTSMHFTDPCSQRVQTRMINGDSTSSTKNATTCAACAPACQQTIYDTTVSTSRWPSDQYMRLLAVQAIQADASTRYDYSAVQSRFMRDMVANATRSTRTNLAEVHVYLQSNMITYIDESADYEFDQLLGDLGGVIGLYVGMTIVTFFEMVEMLCLLLYITVRRGFGHVSGEEEEEMVGHSPC